MTRQAVSSALRIRNSDGPLYGNAEGVPREFALVRIIRKMRM